MAWICELASVSYGTPAISPGSGFNELSLCFCRYSCARPYAGEAWEGVESRRPLDGSHARLHGASGSRKNWQKVMNASSASRSAWRALRVRAPQDVAEDLGLRRKISGDVDGMVKC